MYEDYKRRWQAAFIVGLVLCIAAAGIVYGLTQVTATIGFLALILGIVNALIAPPASTESSSNWVALRARRILNISPYLKVLTVVAWLTVIGISGWSLLVTSVIA